MIQKNVTKIFSNNSMIKLTLAKIFIQHINAKMMNGFDKKLLMIEYLILIITMLCFTIFI